MNENPRLRLLYLLAGTLLALIFWQSPVLYPVKLFVVLLHELSHALTAIVTGGEVLRIEVSSDLGGIALTRGGWSLLVVSSGYLGSMLFGNALFLSSLNERRAKILAVVIGAVVLLTTVVFVRNAFGAAFGVLFSLAMFAAARYLSASWLSMILQLLGMLSSLYALFDVREDLLSLENRTTDAAILAEMTGIPAIAWGVLWSVAALALFLNTLRLSLRSLHRSNENVRHTTAP